MTLLLLVAVDRPTWPLRRSKNQDCILDKLHSCVNPTRDQILQPFELIHAAAIEHLTRRYPPELYEYLLVTKLLRPNTHQP